MYIYESDRQAYFASTVGLRRYLNEFAEVSLRGLEAKHALTRLDLKG